MQIFYKKMFPERKIQTFKIFPERKIQTTIKKPCGVCHRADEIESQFIDNNNLFDY